MRGISKRASITALRTVNFCRINLRVVCTVADVRALRVLYIKLIYTVVILECVKFKLRFVTIFEIYPETDFRDE